MAPTKLCNLFPRLETFPFLQEVLQMTVTRSRFRSFPAALLAILALAVASFAQAQQNTFPQVKIKNFGQMDARFYHWNYDQVYAEMKQYDFYTRFGHGDMKKYVEDYWQHIQTGQVKLVSATTAATR